jgi:hypothetical protein
MATPLDSMFGHFEIIFPFLFVVVSTYAILSHLKLFGEKKDALYGMIAFILGVMFIMSPTVREILNMSAPWFVLFFVFIIFTLVGFMAFGVKSEDIVGVMKSSDYSYINLWIVVIVLIITIGSITTVISRQGGIGSNNGEYPNNYGEISDNSTTSPDLQKDQESAFWNTIVHPKVLGLLLIMLVGMFTIQRLTHK